MLNGSRVWGVHPATSAEDLAGKLKHHSWTLCTGFLWGNLLLLNPYGLDPRLIMKRVTLNLDHPKGGCHLCR